MIISTRNLCVATVAIFAAAFTVAGVSPGAWAAPIHLQGSNTEDGNTISGNLYGDLSGGVLTLNNAPPRSTLTIDAADPPPEPLGGFSLGNYCFLSACNIVANTNATMTINIQPWDFIMGGVIDFDDGTANLSADPMPPATIANISTTATPTFTVNVPQNLGPLQQTAANNEGALIQTILNAGNWQVDIIGGGQWNTIDLGLISAVLDEGGSTRTVGLTLDDTILTGVFAYGYEVSFANSVVDLLGQSFINLFRSRIADVIDDAIVDQLGSLDGNGEFFSFGCGLANPRAQVFDITCIVDASLTLTGELSGAPRVSAPAMLGLSGLGFAVLALARRRRG